MKKRRKIEICPNCDTILNPEANFCPNCGQENHDLKVSVGHLVYETIESITHFDTKLVSTTKAIFTSPGKLTNDFLIGKRARHVHPIRFYIFISFIFFLLINKNIDKKMQDPSILNGIEMQNKVRIIDLLDSTTIKSKKYKEVEDVLLFKSNEDSIIKNGLKVLLKASDLKLDSLLKTDDVDLTQENRNLLLDALKESKKYKKNNDFSLNVLGNEIKFKSDDEKKVFLNSIKTKTDEELEVFLKSKGIDSNWFLRFFFKKFADFDFKNPDDINLLIHGFIKGISMAMFILMPLVAFLLWVFMNRKKYFYEHLIFSVHIHAIYFLFYSIAILINYLLSNEEYRDNVLGWTSIICIIYLIVSLKKVYSKSWISTILRFFVMSVPYIFVFSFVLLGSLVFGFINI